VVKLLIKAKATEQPTITTHYLSEQVASVARGKVPHDEEVHLVNLLPAPPCKSTYSKVLTFAHTPLLLPV
jgi:hypothetical protein